MRKKRQIKAIYEEAEFCEKCNCGMEIVPSSLTLGSQDPQQMMMVWQCPTCHKSYPVTMENQPMQLIDYGEWEDTEVEESKSNPTISQILI